MNELTAAVALIGALGLVACDRQVATPVPAEVMNAAPNKPAQTVAQEPPAPEPAFGESDVRTLVNAWVATQNSSDFAAYSATYAGKFEGIKRVGAKKSSYDREGWLKDRKRMFAKKVEVSAADLVVTTAARSAIARFEQTWASGTFKDVGPKQLVLVLEGDVLKIAREEMLASSVVGDEGGDGLPALDPRKFALVVAPSWIVLQTDTAGLAAGALRVIDRTGVAIADVTDAPPELEGFVGTDFVVEGGETPCRAKVKSLHILARATPHFGEVAYWEGEEGHPKLSDAAVARELWDLAAGPGQILVGELDKECDGAWAHAVDTTLVVFDSTETTAFRDAAVTRFRSLDGYKAIQKDFVQTEKKNAPWDNAGGLAITEYSDSGAKFLAVSAIAGAGCGDFSGEFWALFEVAKGGDLVLLTDPKAPGTYFAPIAAARVGDEVIFFSEEVIVQKHNAVWQRTQDASIPYFDCPC